MNLVVTYDVATTTPTGRRRLRRVAKICEGYGQRVQYSVFEVVCSQTDLAELIKKLDDVIEPAEDSLRIYSVFPADGGAAIHRGILRALPHDEAWTL